MKLNLKFKSCKDFKPKNCEPVSTLIEDRNGNVRLKIEYYSIVDLNKENTKKKQKYGVSK